MLLFYFVTTYDSLQSTRKLVRWYLVQDGLPGWYLVQDELPGSGTRHVLDDCRADRTQEITKKTTASYEKNNKDDQHRHLNHSATLKNALLCGCLLMLFM